MNFFSKFKFCPSCGSSKFIQNNEKSKRCEECDFIYYINPSAATASFIRNSSGELLVCRRAHEPEKGTLDLPGGFADLDETIEQCAIREITEEIGVKPISINFLFTLPNEYLYSGLIVPTMDVFFEAKLDDNAQIQANDDVEECFFLPIREVNPALFGMKSVRKAVKIYIDAQKSEEKKKYFA
ncbi:MAG: NUDIX domain-containing protein [Porphyromonadaceae bacterium]|jgi:NADH pyrophosphatase NudC (nudix superfamily)|nr:NUDIX domain-containing protein [Porphyromonadaceae bacterium]